MTGLTLTKCHIKKKKVKLIKAAEIYIETSRKTNSMSFQHFFQYVRIIFIISVLIR